MRDYNYNENEEDKLHEMIKQQENSLNDTKSPIIPSYDAYIQGRVKMKENQGMHKSPV